MRTITVSTVLIAIASGAQALAGEIPRDQRRSGFDFMTPQTQAMQRDDTANPGMLWVLEGAAAWKRRAGEANRSCADCHGEAAASMRGVAARYPAYDPQEARAIDLQGRVNACRTRQQRAPALAFESRELLALLASISYYSRDLPIAPPADERLAGAREHGRQLFERRMGQLNFSCAQCHDDNWGKRLGGSPIPQGHPTGYPIYRLEWQTVGSLQRRLRNCMSGVRAELLAYGAQEFVDLELFLMERARGLPIESPAVRP
jgi:sulfur-oxidizing protein SoxA